ncbi:MAG: GNAT family N-acetyltransferase [Anaerolineales bacterium]|nr:GNAT family N-acetyltransferase [Anaerolineales bacterium]
MSEVRITAVQNEDERMEFIHFPWQVYRDDPYWVPPLISERKAFHDPKENPFFERARVEYFIARRNGKAVGTIAAFTNDAYNEFQNTNVGFFGFFEVLDDPEAAVALLSAAENWARQAGHDSIIGPEMFTTNDEVGLLVDGFDDVPRILMTYNPPRYMEYLENAGFQKAMDLWAYSIKLDDFMQNLPEKLVRVVEKVKARRKLTIRTLRMKEFDEEVMRFKHVYNRSWERNWGFVPLNDAEIDYIAKGLKQILDPDLVLFLEHEGEVVGAGLSLPDLNAPLRLAYPRPGVPEIFTMLKLFWHWKIRPKQKWMRAWALGVLPEYRGRGIDAMLYLVMAQQAARKGYKWVEMSWTLETNDMVNRSVRLLGGELYKTYRLYEKRLR